MSGVWQQSIVRILDSSSSLAAEKDFSRGGVFVIGSGALVMTPQIGACVVTAAHVVNAALGLSAYATKRPESDEFIGFDLPMKGVGSVFSGRVVEWAPPRSSAMRAQYPISDIALLQVLESDDGASLPSDLRFHRPEDFVVLGDEELQGLMLYGFGFSRSDGAFAEGRLEGAVASGWLHLVGVNGGRDFIAPSFSGAPMFDAGRQRIFGMAVAIDRDDDKRLAFLQSSRNIWKACPQLAHPYPGLKAFEERDAPFFFGREAFVARMQEKAGKFPLFGVTAASGSGKSSAIRAGLIPKLRATDRSLLFVMRPLHDPWKQLALQITREAKPEADPLAIDEEADARAKLLRENPQKLLDYATALLSARGAERLVIFVDQFEELFTLAGHDRQEPPSQEQGSQSSTRAALPDFRDLMAATARLEGAPQVQWIYALRGDFAGRAFKHRGFVDRIGDGDVKLADMTADELLAAIGKPAAALGVKIESGSETRSGLIGRIAANAGITAGALPLMQHVLEQLWRRMRDRRLTHEAYDQLGGLQGALNQHADKVFDRLSKDEQSLARILFSRLVNVEEDGETTRRVARRSELGDESWTAAQKLAGEDSRLLTMSGGGEETAGADEGTNYNIPADDAGARAGSKPLSLVRAEGGEEETVEVAHEALLRHWEKLRKWIDDDRRFLLWRRRLEQQLREHQEALAQGGAWLTGGPLQIALSWLATREEDLTKEEQQFIESSHDREREETASQRRRARQLIVALLVIAIVSVGAAVGGVWLWGKQRLATAEAHLRATRRRTTHHATRQRSLIA